MLPVRLLRDVAYDGWCRLSYSVMYNMSTSQTVSMCFTTCFMLHAFALRMVLVDFVIFILVF